MRRALGNRAATKHAQAGTVDRIDGHEVASVDDTA